MYKFLLLILTASYLLVSPSVSFAQTSNDITAKIENLGNPTKTKWPDTNTACRYARNPWDMISANGKIYLGSGNYDNRGPCANAGPVPIATYDSTSQTFSTFNTSDEQIDKFVMLDGSVVAPGLDPRGSPVSGNWYRVESGNWVLHANIPDGAHNFDMLSAGGRWFAALGTGVSGYWLQSSSNGGTSWTNVTGAGIIDRGYNLFSLGGQAYISRVWNPAALSYTGLFQINPTTPSITAVTQATIPAMFPNTPTTGISGFKLMKYLNYNGSLVYIASDSTAPWTPLGIYKMSQLSPTTGANFSSVQKFNLPNNATPWDVSNGSDGKVYALGSIVSGTRYWITVSSSSDLINWTEEFRFDSPTFARSFEQINGDFYFGLGTDATTLSINSGDILRYKIIALTPSPSAAIIKPGDLDNDGDIDIFDYNLLLTNFGKTGSGIQGDIDNTGKVDIFNYNLLLTNFGR